MNIAAALTSARRQLQMAGVADPTREASSLLAFALNRSSTFLIAHPEYELTSDGTNLFVESVQRRANREPFQYIVGRKEFYGLDFEVSPDVLIPRPETEILVEDAIRELQGIERPHFFEIGVGSGCISISILHHVNSATAVGTDISDRALGVAHRTAATHRVADRIELLNGDVFGGVSGKFDAIVSNPPYIPVGDVLGLQPEVVNFEPHTALAGGPDGLDIVRRLVTESPEHLKPGGVLLIEIGSGQASAVGGLCDPAIWDAPVFLLDLQGIQRVLKVCARS